MLHRSLEHFAAALRGGAVSIGNFDGVHLGHARIVERLLAMARDIGGPAVVFTFDPHPCRILRPQSAPAPLCWTERKAELLESLGVDAVVAYPTDEAFLQLSARQFFAQVLQEKLAARAIVEGANFYFGHDRGGNVEVLGEFCQQAGVTLEVVPPLLVDGQIVSSSRLRKLVAAGKLGQARALLGHPYRIRGVVAHGAGRGATLGFPTANLAQVDTLLPGLGIYAGWAQFDGAVYPAAISLGTNPTFNEGEIKVEAYLLGYRGSLYDRHIEIDFIERLRDIRRFESVEQLLREMRRDVAATQQIVASA